MGGTFSQVIGLLWRNKCSPSAVASMLTFLPPNPPCYTLEKTENENKYEMKFDRRLIGSTFDSLEISMIKTRRGTIIPGFLFRYPDAKFTILFSHGNAADCGSMREFYIYLCRQCEVNVFAYDYSGYGAATGSPSEQNTYADIEAAYDFLVKNKIVQDASREIVLYGQSVGSGPSCKLATMTKKRPICGLILHSPILSGVRVIMDKRGIFCCCDIYPNISLVKKIRVPVFIIHGCLDSDVSVTHGERLYEALRPECKYEPWWVRGAGHNDIVETKTHMYFQAIEDFIIFLNHRLNPLDAAISTSELPLLTNSDI